MEWKFSCTFDSEADKEIIELIKSIPKGNRSKMVREVFRKHMDIIEVTKPDECQYCFGSGFINSHSCYICQDH